MTLVQQISDGTAKSCVEAALAGLHDVDPLHLAVTVDSSVVVVYGEVDNELQRTTVLEAAGRAAGQRAVVDRLAVREPWQEADDVRLAAAAGAALGRLHVHPSTAFSADVRGGTVTLRGTVTWPHQRQQARDAVAELPGVTAVRNAIVVSEPALPAASDVRSAIATALEADLEADLAHVQVLVDRHRVTLHGHVASHDVKREAERAAATVPGVQHVDSHLVVHSRLTSPGAELWSN